MSAPAKRWVVAVLATAAVTGIMIRRANACIDGASPTETAFANTIPCDQNDIVNIAHDYALTQDDSWVPAGLKDDCNSALPFAKVMNAIAFIGLGPHLQLGGFHDTIDYMNESRSHRSNFHGNFYLRFVQQGALPNSEADSEVGRFEAEDRTNLHCLIFNLPPPGGGASSGFLAERAAAMVHEAWHHWQHANGLSSSHTSGPTGNCKAAGPGCDNYYYHPPDFQFPDGSLSSQLNGLNFNNCVPGLPCTILGFPTQPSGYTHSAYQVMVEFSSDMANFANPFIVPFAARVEARLVGNGHIAQNFVNAVPYTIGIPVPFPKIRERQNP
jgi:hypothetical protein